MAPGPGPQEQSMSLDWAPEVKAMPSSRKGPNLVNSVPQPVPP